MALVAWYKLEENAENTMVADSSDSGYDATCNVNTSTLSTTGIVGSAFSFSGTQHVSRDAVADLSAYVPWTFSAWFWWATETGVYHLMANVLNNTSGSYDKVSLRIYADSKVRFTRYTDTGTVLRRAGYATANEWHHVAATNGGDGSLALYLDGVWQSGTYYSTTIGNALRFTVGSTTDFTYGLSGGVDDVRVYNKVLTISQINAIRASDRATALAYPWEAAARRRLFGR